VFVLGSRNGHIWALSQLSLCTHNSDSSHYNYFSIFVYFFPRMAHHFFGHHDSPSNLAESWYPRGGSGDLREVSASVTPSALVPRGGRNIFSRHRCLNLPRSWGTHPTPPHTLRKDSIFNFGAKIQIDGAKIQIYGDKIQIYISKTQICGAKIQTFDPKFKYLNFCTTKNLPLCTRKSPGFAGWTPTHPPIFVCLFGIRRPIQSLD